MGRRWRGRGTLLALLIAVTAACTHAAGQHDHTGIEQEVVVTATGDIEQHNSEAEILLDRQPGDVDLFAKANDDTVRIERAAHEPHKVSGSYHRDMFFHYLAQAGIQVDVTPYIPAFAYDTEWSEIWSAIEDAMIGTYDFCWLWAVVLWRLSVPLMRLTAAVLEALLPHFLTGMQVLAEAVYELDPVYQASLAVAFVFTVICYHQGYVGRARLRFIELRRDLRHRYREFVLSLSEKSRLVALAMPHVLFLVGVYVIVFWSPPIVLDLWDNQSLTVLLSVGIPLVRSISAIHKRRKEELRREQQADNQPPTEAPTRPRRSNSAIYNEWRPYEACLKYWVLWSIAVCVSSVVSLFVPSFLAAYFSLPTYMLNIVLAWMHSPVARGDIALYTLLSPLVNPYANRIADTYQDTGADNDNDGNNQTNMIMRALEAVGVMRRQHLHFLKDMWSQGPALGGLMFVFTPGFVTARGALLVGFGFPAYVTMGALADKRARTYEWWLQYFVVAVVADYLLTAVGASVAWLPLFFHAKLLVLMWLQFPYFRGAKQIFDAMHTSMFVAARREQ